MSTRSRALPVALAATLLVAACGGGSSASPSQQATEPPASAEVTPGPTSAPVTLDLAHSYTDTQPQAACGAQVIKEEAEAANVGLTIEIFGGSTLGGDTDRVAMVQAGDHDLDIQGASALSSVYEPMAVVDGAFVFDDSEHLYNFFTSDASDGLKEGFLETGLRILGAWNTGARQFTANVPIRTPEDLQGLRMRFPGSPQFLMNARAMGIEPVVVAFEELYLALQQGTVDGQENPLVNIVSNNLDEVQDYVSLSSHQLSSNLVVINGDSWDGLSAEQQEALSAAVETAMVEEPECVVEAEAEILAGWADAGSPQVIDDVDREAFQVKAEAYLRENFTAEQVELLEAIRSMAE
ncbi:MAG TPA: DctP family TRAP transporter solute-binding subunit [Candidatus Limnocylindrales bacterium]|nr:DctP family TRAP transporter solute-binding subunit [Candidatus Limnocylindrales bacterium]